MAKQLNVSVISYDILTSHWLFNTNSYSSNSTKTEKNQHPTIIVRFSNRDKRNEIFNQRQKFRENLPKTSDSSNHNNLILKNVTNRENLTKYRRFLYAEANKVKNKLCFSTKTFSDVDIFIYKMFTFRSPDRGASSEQLLFCKKQYFILVRIYNHTPTIVV